MRRNKFERKDKGKAATEPPHSQTANDTNAEKGQKTKRRPADKPKAKANVVVTSHESQSSYDINYGKGQKILVLHVAEKPSIAQVRL
jgi:hypothetical protein